MSNDTDRGWENPVPARILGIGGWLIYGRAADGRLVWIQVETDPHWLHTPFRGKAEYGSGMWRHDWLAMLMQVARHREDYAWSECGPDTDGTRLGWPAGRDDDFAAAAAASHLPSGLGPMPADQGTSLETRPLLCGHSESDGGRWHWLPAGVRTHEIEPGDDDDPGDDAEELSEPAAWARLLSYGIPPPAARLMLGTAQAADRAEDATVRVTCTRRHPAAFVVVDKLGERDGPEDECDGGPDPDGDR